MRKPATLIAVLVLAAASGCVRRTLSVTSDPPGAELVINGQPAGRTPARLGFSHHGVYRLELRKKGYRPVTDALRLRRKLYEYPGFDFVSEVLWPGTIRDGRAAHYKLEKSPPFDAKKLLSAARRAAAEAERVIPRLHEAPPPRPGAKDRRLLPRVEKPEKPPKKKPAGEKPALPEPPDVPEIEEGRGQ